MSRRARKAKEESATLAGPTAAAQSVLPADAPSSRPTPRAAAFVLPLLMLASAGAVWFGPAPTLSDPWENAARDLTPPAGADAVSQAAGFRLAAAELTRLADLYPRHARVHYMAAFALFRTGNADAAISHAREAIRLGSGAVVNPVDGAAREVLVAALIEKSESAMARREYQAAASLLAEADAQRPSTADILIRLGNALLLKGDPSAARAPFEKALALQPRNAQMHVTLATIYRDENQREKAIQYLEKAIALDPKLANAREILGQMRPSSGGAR